MTFSTDVVKAQRVDAESSECRTPKEITNINNFRKPTDWNDLTMHTQQQVPTNYAELNCRDKRGNGQGKCDWLRQDARNCARLDDVEVPDRYDNCDY